MSRSVTDPNASARSSHGISDARTILGSGPAREDAPSERFERGAMIGRYIVIDPLGHGGMGVVYTAYDPKLDRKVALKLVLPDGRDASSARRRLLREAQAIAQLSHPNVVTVHDVGTVAEHVFIAMELVDGVDLAEWLETQRTADEVLGQFVQAGKGLSAAHAAGLIHRDFKPENVLVGNDGRTRVVDFGLARRDDRTQDGDSSLSNTAELLGVSPAALASTGVLERTDAGLMVGTPAYMSPEQFAGQPGDERSDQFSFCVALYEGLYGERPFRGRTISELTYAVMVGEIRDPPESHRIPTRWRKVLLRGLAVEPDARYPDMPTLLAALHEASAPAPRRWLVLGALAAATAAAAVAGIIALREPPAPDPCAGVESELAIHWNADRRASIERAFVGTGRPFAQETWQRAEAQLDGYFTQWGALRRGLCEEGQSQEVPDPSLAPRLRCLDERLHEVSDVLAIFERPDARTIIESIPMVHALSRVSSCAELETIDALPEPVDPALAEQVRSIRDKIRRWQMQQRLLGPSREDTLRIEDLLARGKALGFPPLEAEMQLLTADLSESKGSIDEAIDQSNLAFETALSCNYDRFAMRAATDLVYLHGVSRTEPERAFRWARRARALMTRGRGDAMDQLRLLNSWAAAHANAAQDEPAQRRFEQALELARTQDDPSALAHVLNNLGAFHATNKRIELAQTYLDEAADLYERTFGPNHPSVLRSRANSGLLAAIDERPRDAIEVLEPLLDRQREVLGPENATVANTLGGLASSYAQLEQFERAIALREEVVELQRRQHGPASTTTIRARLDLAETLVRAERYEPARPLLREIQAQLEAQANPLPRAEVRMYLTLARATVDDDRPAALALARKAQQIVREDESLRDSPKAEELEAWLRDHAPPTGETDGER